MPLPSLHIPPEDISLQDAHALVKPLMMAIAKKRNTTETLPIIDALGRILANDLSSTLNVPSQDTAAVDGYAFYFDELSTPLPIIGSIKAGHPYEGKATSGHAYRIFTGAIMPDGPDTVAMQEHCSFDNEGNVILPQNLRRGTNYRPKGENVAEGEKVIKAGTILGSAEIGLAAAIGHHEVTVKTKLKIALLSMGDEVVEAAEEKPLGLGMIYDSNRPMLTTMLQAMGHEVLDYGIVADDLDMLTSTFNKAASEADVILCSGGSSEGEEDHTKSAILNNDGVIDFWRLTLKPGRPMVSGRIGDVPIFGLPGNPVAAFVCTRLFAAPMMACMQGAQSALPQKFKVSSGFTKSHRKGRTEYLRARLEEDNQGNLTALPNGRAGAGVLSSLTGADGLIEIPADHDDVKIGDMLPFLSFKEAGL